MAYVQIRDIVRHLEAKLVSALWDAPQELALENDSEGQDVQSARRRPSTERRASWPEVPDDTVRV